MDTARQTVYHSQRNLIPSFWPLVQEHGLLGKKQMSRETEQTSVEPVPEGKYIYCIIETDEPRSFGPMGIGGRGDEVYTVHHKGLAAVV